jgi:hypothetical protein
MALPKLPIPPGAYAFPNDELVPPARFISEKNLFSYESI